MNRADTLIHKTYSDVIEASASLKPVSVPISRSRLRTEADNAMKQLKEEEEMLKKAIIMKALSEERELKVHSYYYYNYIFVN
jgi:hypothetical protein